MTIKNKLILWASLLILVFLAGYVPQYLELRRLREELRGARGEVTDCRFRMDLCHLQGDLCLLYLETAKKNYGNASEFATRFFDRLAQTAAVATEPELKQLLDRIKDERDSVVSKLAQGDMAALAEIQVIFDRLHERLQSI